jgi:anti-anti-sigma factor
MTLKRERRGDVHVVTPRTDLMGGHETHDLREAVQEIAAQAAPRIVVDLGEISWMNSLGLGALVAAHVTCSKRDGWLRIARIDRRIRSIFLITRLILILETFDTVEEAIAGAAVHPVS